ncbi:2-(3-amino-3-carboxypropyl)histidine synthase subunit 2-like isoform X1 [Ptychodera flava]|uniref:2-(3-amino-3-carboxypropyl)histidine synthase subunit 2-like isoform X1 n=2 Tax=Ptychodera flava TaxID=63121 RepID=UPI00396A0702
MTSSGVAFSTDATDAIQRTVVTVNSEEKKDKDELLRIYEVQRCVDYINTNKYEKVALQFPDSMLVDSVAVENELSRQTSAKFVVLGDTSYGSCCVDEVAAQHVNADSIIHFGRTCLSPTRRLPVLFVFGQQDIDVEHCFSSFKELFPDSMSHVVVLYDVVYAHSITALSEKLCQMYPNVVISSLEYPNSVDMKTSKEYGASQSASLSNHTDLKTIIKFGRRFTLHSDKSMADFSMFYIGGESLTLTNLMMTFNRCQFCSYDPGARRGRQETVNINKSLMKRYYLIEKAKDAHVVGIVAGTLGVANYLDVISRLKEMIKLAGKKSYMFVMGKINVPKMANFMEVDVFVLVACPENSLLDSSEYYKPIVTPFEMELACNQAREWTGEYETDFRQILPGGSTYVDLPSSETSMGLKTDISLITGGVRRLGREEEEVNDAANSSAVVKRDDVLTVSTVHHSGAEYLASRSWSGLEQRLGETPVSDAVEGQRGIAAGYANEPKAETKQ